MFRYVNINEILYINIYEVITTYLKYLEQCLAHNEGSININCAAFSSSSGSHCHYDKHSFGIRQPGFRSPSSPLIVL